MDAPDRKRVVVILEVGSSIEVTRFPTRLAAVTFVMESIERRADCARAAIAEDGFVVYAVRRTDAGWEPR